MRQREKLLIYMKKTLSRWMEQVLREMFMMQSRLTLAVMRQDIFYQMQEKAQDLNMYVK